MCDFLLVFYVTISEERTAMPSDVPGEVEVDYKAAESASDESDTKVTKHTKQVTAPWNKKKLDSEQCWRKVTIWWAYWQKTDDKAWWKFRRKETSCELFKLFYTNEMNKHLVYQSLEYARQQNNHALDVNIYWVATIHSLVSNFFIGAIIKMSPRVCFKCSDSEQVWGNKEEFATG